MNACARWWLAAMLSASLAARAAPPDIPARPGAAKAKATGSPASGAVIEYQESPSGTVIYHEQGGGMISNLPAAPKRAPATPPPQPVQAAKKPSSGAPVAATKKPSRGAPVAAAKKPSAEAPVTAARKPARPPTTATAAPAPAPPAVSTWAERVDRAAGSGDNAALIALGAEPDARMDCARPDLSWSIARAHEEAGNVEAASSLLEPLLQCRDAVVRTTTLEIARELVEPETLYRWMAREAPAERTGEAAQRYDRLAITLAIGRSISSKAPAPERARAMEAEVGNAIVRFRDAASATTLGWLWLTAKDPATAALWFGRARTWSPESDEAARGALYAALQERRFDEALALAASLPPTLAEKRTILRDAHLGKATNAFNNDRFAEALDHLARAAESEALPRHAREMEAWSYNRLGRKADAARRFAELYREAPDRTSAEGLLAASESRTQIDANLTATEPLATMLRADAAVQAFNASRFLEAAALAPARYAGAGAVGAPQAVAYAGWGNKSGEPGLSRFRTQSTLAVEGGAVVADGLALRLRAGRHKIETGVPSPTALLGSAPASGPDPSITLAETRANVTEVRLIGRLERRLAVNASIGALSSEAGLDQRVVGGVEVEGAPAWGQFAVGVSREPVRESVLAYAGMRDPYSGTSWGRVARDALAARVLVLKAAPWTVGLSARLARLEGVGVQSNTQRVGEASIGRDLGIPGFAYSAASVSISSDSYERNLGNFTLGHGGYFSPQRYRRVGTAIDFMTPEDRAWLVRGRASAGVVSKRVDAAPILPLAPDGRFYDASPTQSARDVSANLSGVVRVSPHVQLAAGIARSISPQFGETLAFVQVRILFEPRRSVVSADLPSFIR